MLFVLTATILKEGTIDVGELEVGLCLCLFLCSCLFCWVHVCFVFTLLILQQRSWSEFEIPNVSKLHPSIIQNRPILCVLDRYNWKSSQFKNKQTKQTNTEQTNINKHKRWTNPKNKVHQPKTKTEKKKQRQNIHKTNKQYLLNPIENYQVSNLYEQIRKHEVHQQPTKFLANKKYNLSQWRQDLKLMFPNFHPEHIPVFWFLFLVLFLCLLLLFVFVLLVVVCCLFILFYLFCYFFTIAK